MNAKNHNLFRTVISFSTAAAIGTLAYGGVPLNNLQGTGGIAFNPLAYTAGLPWEYGSTSRGLPKGNTGSANPDR